jgi:hypothetical protein
MICIEPVFAIGASDEGMSGDAGRGARRTGVSGDVLVGSPFIGAATSVDGRVSGLTVSVVVGTSVGEAVGTIAIDRRGRDSRRYHFKGAMNARGLFVWHGSTEDGCRAVLTGTVDPEGNSLGGKYMSQEPAGMLEAGTFLASRA